MKIFNPDRKLPWLTTGLVSLVILSLGAAPVFAGKHKHGGRHHFMLDQQTIESLDLQPAQQQMLDDLKTRAKTMHQTGREQMKIVKQVFDEERQKPEPDMRRVAEAAEKASETRHKSKQEMRAAMLDFYDTLDAEQKRTVVEALNKRFSHHSHHKERSSSRDGGWRFKAALN